jgi:Zn finger protein HypA/HybF involved in hydrogenase expression
MRRLTIEEIKKTIENNGDELITKIYDPGKHIEFKCHKCNENHSGYYSNIKRGYRSCASGKRIVWTLEKVKAYFAKYGCVFLDDWFDNVLDKHNFKCKCGRLDKIDLHHFKRHKRCGKCGKTRKLTIEEAKSNIRSKGGELLATEWINTWADYDFICVCGNPYRCRYNNFMSGKRCCRGTGGFKRNKLSYLYLLAYNDLFKVGIYNEGTRRLQDHAIYGWKLVDQIGPLMGRDIETIETLIFQMFTKKGILTGAEAGLENFDGYTECWSAKDFFVESIADLWNRL